MEIIKLIYVQPLVLTVLNKTILKLVFEHVRPKIVLGINNLVIRSHYIVRITVPEVIMQITKPTESVF